MTDTAAWLAQQGIGGPVGYFENAGLLARRAADAADLAVERAEAERQAALEEARDQRLTAMYLAGVQPGAVMARSMQLADLDGEISTRQAEIEKLERRRDRLQAEGREQAALASRSAAIAARSSPAGLGDVAERMRRSGASWRHGRGRTMFCAGRGGSRRPGCPSGRLSQKLVAPRAALRFTRPGRRVSAGCPAATLTPLRLDGRRRSGTGQILRAGWSPGTAARL